MSSWLTNHRAAFFVDGNNFYHACVNVAPDGTKLMSARDHDDIDFRKLAEHLAGPDREVVSIQYYIGELDKDGNNKEQYDRQQRLFSELEKDGVIVCGGRMVKRPIKNKPGAALSKLLSTEAFRIGLPESLRRELWELQEQQTVADAVKAWLDELPGRNVQISATIYMKLNEWCTHYDKNFILQEKGIDVRLAVDMTAMAYRDEYDVAYLLSGDGDFIPAVEEIQYINKKVFAVACGEQSISALYKAADTCLPIAKREYFHGLWRDKPKPYRTSA